VQQIYDKYKSKGFIAMGFPCNQFGGQEPGTNAEIKEYAQGAGITFPLFAKIDVNGPKETPVYTFLKKCFPGDITWNFSSKWIINRAGVPVRRFEADSWKDIDRYIDDLLNEPAPGADTPAPAAATAATAAPVAPAPAAAAAVAAPAAQKKDD